MELHNQFFKILTKKVGKTINQCSGSQAIPIKQFQKKFTPKKWIELLKYFSTPRIMEYGNDTKFTVSYTKDSSFFNIECIDSPTKLQQSVGIYKKELKNLIINLINELDEDGFDLLLVQILTNEKINWIKNFKLREKKQGDKGIDFMCELLVTEENTIGFNEYGKFIQIGGQIKAKQDQSGTPVIRDLRGALDRSKHKAGMLISKNGISGDGIEEANLKSKPIFLLEKNKLAEEMVCNNIGVDTITLVRLKDIDEKFWSEIKSNSSKIS